jgi:hypothetical protein
MKLNRIEIEYAICGSCGEEGEVRDFACDSCFDERVAEIEILKSRILQLEEKGYKGNCDCKKGIM